MLKFYEAVTIEEIEQEQDWYERLVHNCFGMEHMELDVQTRINLRDWKDYLIDLHQAKRSIQRGVLVYKEMERDEDLHCADDGTVYET